LPEEARGVAELDLDGEEGVLHAHACADTCENLEADNLGGGGGAAEGVEEAGADGEETGGGEEEGPTRE
jgi:hypothetical protein